jgi:hypothetical protein
MSTRTDVLSAATAKQKALEGLALKLCEAPAVRAAREEARQIFLNQPYAQTRDGQASLEDAAAQHFYGAVEMVINTDPYHPEILQMFMYEHEIDGQRFPSALHGGLEVPDNVYRIIPISPDSRYELRGVRHTPAPAQVTYELMDSIPGVHGGIGEQLAMLKDRDMQIAEDGSFTITLDTEPAGGRPNHIQITPETKALFIRDTLADWRIQRADQLSVVRTGGPERPRRTEEQMVEEAARLVPVYSRFWAEFPAAYVKKMGIDLNRFRVPYARPGGWQLITNAHFEIGDDEAFVFTTNPKGMPYHSVLIGNHWWITLDSARRSGGFNNSQVKYNRDGTITYVIAATDPGAHNWLDTGGLHEGIIQVRWQGALDGITTLPDGILDARLVKLSELKQQLPEETVWLTPAERKAQLEERRASYQLRLVLP